MPQTAVFLTFNDQAEQAARFYTSVFRNSKVTRTARYPDLGPESGAPFKAGGVMTVDFTIDGREFTALNAGPNFAFGQGVSISVLCDTQRELDEYWDKIVAAGGTPIACGWITDHFGVTWQIDPRGLVDMISDPDPARAARAMRSMMKMVKIDGEEVRRAWGG